ncbi:helix-turn-helix domain-containing protein, partial [Streptomyces sp. NPDC056670]|uniref:helix-turn-helix domain-containing protein n=1 Tax=Streptomyces sp. NPDC056670 TaxID=3345904 RepID=UPI00368CD135
MILGSKLARAREAAGLTVEQVAAEQSVSAATIYRQESGHVAVKPTMIPFLVGLYGIKDKAVERRWEEWARAAKIKGPWAASGSTVGPSYRDYADVEDMAEVLRTWQLGVIPGLLQTRRYSEEVINAAATVRPGQTPSESEEIAALLKLREIRKGILERDEPPRIWAVIGEPAVLTPPSVTDKSAHREQLQHLLNLGDTKVTIQVLPMDTGLHGCLSGSFSIVTIDDLDLVFREGYGDGSFVDDKERVRSYTDRFERLVMQAMSVADTRMYLH